MRISDTIIICPDRIQKQTLQIEGILPGLQFHSEARIILVREYSVPIQALTPSLIANAYFIIAANVTIFCENTSTN